MPPKKDPTPIYIEGPKMDWAMDDGLYPWFLSEYLPNI